MVEPNPAIELPAWVRKRDGRVAAFDGDEIARDLFDAAVALGQPDPFLVRELTEGVLHFLVLDAPEAIPATAWIAELVEKVVRELRQPRLAAQFARRTRQVSPPAAATARPDPRALARQAWDDFSLAEIYAPDVAAAHRAGLITLHGLQSPSQAAGLVLTPGGSGGPRQALDFLEILGQARHLAEGWASLEGPEYLGGQDQAELLLRLLPLADSPVRLQLGLPRPPAWANAVASGPLFGGEPASPSLDRPWLLERLQAKRQPFDWHAGVREAASRSTEFGLLARLALAGAPVQFVFDRSRKAVWLGPGLDHQHPAALLAVALDLAALHAHTGRAADPEEFLGKLPNLAGLAVSAGVQKRSYLRKTLPEDSPLVRGFMLERARLVVCPVGLECLVEELTGEVLTGSARAVELGRRMVLALQDGLTRFGRRRGLEAVMDVFDRQGGLAAVDRPSLKAIGRLHAAMGGGLATWPIDAAARPAPEALADLISFAARETEVARLEFRLAAEAAGPDLLEADEPP